MSTKVFTNPTNAYGQADSTGYTQFQQVGEFEASAAITQGQIVKIDDSATTVSPATAATAVAIGVALDGAAVGQTVRVCLKGFCLVQAAGTSVAANTAFSAGASGRVAAATSTNNQWVVGITREATGTSAGALKQAWIDPSQFSAT